MHNRLAIKLGKVRRVNGLKTDSAHDFDVTCALTRRKRSVAFSVVGGHCESITYVRPRAVNQHLLLLSLLVEHRFIVIITILGTTFCKVHLMRATGTQAGGLPDRSSYII